MSITKKGIFWELINSLWIIFSVMGIPWAGFLYIGKTAKNNKWKVYAFLYALVQLAAIIGCGVFAYDSVISTVCAIVICVQYVVGIVHNVLSRKEYLLAKEYIVMNGLDEIENEKIRENIRRNFENKEEPVVIEQEDVQEEFNYSDHLYSEESKINLNISSKEELLTLPGVTSEIAEKAINFRKKFGGFASTKEFVEILQIDSRYLSEIQKKSTVK